jgi:hypothetical protein
VKVFEMMAVETFFSHRGGPFSSMGRVSYALSEEAEDILASVLDPYDQHPGFFFDSIDSGRKPAVWAFVCLDKEYEIAGHIAKSRLPDAGIRFTQYTQIPNNPPKDFIPKVGVISLMSKDGLERSAHLSPVFNFANEALYNCQENRRWVALLDPLDGEWLGEAILRNNDLWIESRSDQI